MPNPSDEASALDAQARQRLLPAIITPLPGPRTQALMARDHRVLSPSYTRGYPLSIARGEGCMVEDLDGNRFLDYTAGIAVCATGHSHPQVVAAMEAQARAFLHMSGTDFYYDAMVTLAERLAATATGDPDRRVFFGNSGAEANEGALKLARYATGRQALISFWGSFHGRTMGALTLGASKVVQKTGFAPFLPGVFHAPYPNFYRDPFQTDSPEACAERCLWYIQQVLFKQVVPPSEVAAFVVEPIQGEGGYIVPPDNFLLGLQALARQHGILVIVDEVQAGMGRTGKLWASDHVAGFDPDIITSAKGLASGMPLGAVIARRPLMTWPPGAHASTFGGNPVSCAAALATLDLLENGLMENAARQGQRLLAGLRQLCAEDPNAMRHVGEVRGRGLMLGVEIVADVATRAPDAALRNRIVDACFERGLLILGCGESAIRWCPPLVLAPVQVEAALEIFKAALHDVAASG
jgi:4-aminobutyrate aminotransferase